MKTINEKTTKTGLINYLANLAKENKVTDKNLAERIAYTLKKCTEDATAIAKTDLFDLVKETLIPVVTPAAVVENSLKPVPKVIKVTPKEEVKEETKTEEVKPTPKLGKPKAATDKKAAKTEKPAAKVAAKVVEKKEEVTTIKPLNPLSIPTAKCFPATIKHPDLGTLIAKPQGYRTVAEISAAITENVGLVFATYWSLRQIKEYDYSKSFDIPAKNLPNKGFPDNLDLLQAIVSCEKMPRVYAMSVYTEAMFRFDDNDLVPVEDNDSNGDKYAVRVCNGMEFEIYEIAPEKEAAPAK